MKKVCIVGYGAIGTVHANVIKNVDSTELYAVCDIDSKKLSIAQGNYAGIKFFRTLEEAICDFKVDAFHICTPHYLHFDMIKKVLATEKIVVVEKPVTMTKSEFDELLKIKGAKNVCVTFQNRYNPCVIKLFELIHSRKYGNVIGINASLIWKRDKSYYDSADWRGTRSMEGGGVLINQAIHTLDILIAIGGKPVLVKANKSNLSLKGIIEVEDTIFANIDFENKARGVFFATNSALADSAPQIEVICEKGHLIYNNRNLYLNDKFICSDDVVGVMGKRCWGMGHTELLKDFYENNKFISPYDVKNTMNTMFAIYESAENNGNEVEL